MERIFLRPAEAAQLIGFSRAAIYQLIRTERLPACKIGKSIRINRAALEQWAAKKATEFSQPTCRHRRTAKENSKAQPPKATAAPASRADGKSAKTVAKAANPKGNKR